MAHRGRPCVRLTLNAEQRTELQRRVRAGTSCQRDGRRARIILASEDGGSAAAVAQRVGVHPRTVERWRERFRRARVRGLQDKPRPGPPPKLGPVTRLELIALACEPVAHREGKTTRTLAELVDEAIARHLVDGIGWSSYQRLLAASDLRPHRIHGWLHSPDPPFREKVTEITDRYRHPPAGAGVLSIDENPGMQALERRFPDRPAAPGRRRRREFAYRRPGTPSLLCAFEVHRGRVVADCGATRTAHDLGRFMERIAALSPTETVHVIWDNLNIHFDGADQRWTAFNARPGQRFVFHYTPKHASWVNQVELFFSILQRQCLRDASFRSIEELRAAVREFIAAWNRDRAHPFRWTFTGYPLQAGAAVDAPKAAWGGPLMAPRTRTRLTPVSSLEADALQRALHALGDYAHVAVRAARGHLHIFIDDGAPVARVTPLGAPQYGLSFHSHTGRWEKMPLVGDLVPLAHELVIVLGPYLARPDFSGGIRGSGH